MTALTPKQLRFECDRLLEMIFDEESGCEACQQQVLKALMIVRDAHNYDACSRYKEYRMFKEHNSKIEKKLRALLF